MGRDREAGAWGQPASQKLTYGPGTIGEPVTVIALAVGGCLRHKLLGFGRSMCPWLGRRQPRSVGSGARPFGGAAEI